jgi:hypothetical protein
MFDYVILSLEVGYVVVDMKLDQAIGQPHSDMQEAMDAVAVLREEAELALTYDC